MDHCRNASSVVIIRAGRELDNLQGNNGEIQDARTFPRYLNLL
jgi:hypothetical protein